MDCKANEYCRFCNCYFKVKFGNLNTAKASFISYENLFKPSRRKDSLGIVLANICEEVGLTIAKNNNCSERCCNPCARKIRNLGQLYSFVKSKVYVTTTPLKSQGKRPLETPDKSSPSWRRSKAAKVKSPSRQVRKSLSGQYSAAEKDVEYLNIDDLPSDGLQVKVVLRNPNGNVVVRIPRDEDSKSLVKQIALRNWSAASNAVLKHHEMQEDLNTAIRTKVSSEFEKYLKSGSMLDLKSPDEIAGFSNRIFIKEIKVYCPLWYTLVLGACGLKETDLKYLGSYNINAAALATATLVRVRNSSLSALHYRISTILFHSGVRYEDLVRLNRLGVSVSPDSIIRLQRKMGETLESKVQVWKEEIVKNRSTLALCVEVKHCHEPSVEPTQDEGVQDDSIDTTRVTLEGHSMFTDDSFNLLIKLMDEEQQRRGELYHTKGCLDSVINCLQTTILPLYK